MKNNGGIFNIAIVTMVKNEQKYLKEWIEWHLSLGVDVIHIYEDIDSSSHSEITNNYNQVFLHSIQECYEDKLDRIDIQAKLYNYFICNYKHDYDWCAFIDVDEFIIGDLTILNNYKNFTGIYVKWKVFNANNHIISPEGKLMYNYTQSVSCLDYDRESWNHKSIVNMKMNPIMKDCHSILNGVDCQELIINHYITKSFEDYCWRIFERGDIYHRIYRKLEDFYLLNPNIDKKACQDFLFEKYGTNPELYIQNKEYYPEEKQYNKSIKIIKTDNIIANSNNIHIINTICGTCNIQDPYNIINGWKYYNNKFIYKVHSGKYDKDVKASIEITNYKGETHLININILKNSEYIDMDIQLLLNSFSMTCGKQKTFISFIAPRRLGKLNYLDPSGLYSINFTNANIEILAQKCLNPRQDIIKIFGEHGGYAELTIKRGLT